MTPERGNGPQRETLSPIQLGVTKNVVAESECGAIGLINSPHLTMLNNIFYDNGSGSQIDLDSMPGSVWDYNIHYPYFSWPPKQPVYDQHSLFGVDPRFLNSAVGDYGLRVDSPAIDRGVALSEFNYDKNATPRPQITAWDIGAYEAVPEEVLHGAPADRAIHLTWMVNITLPVTSTWRIDYARQTGTAYLPITGITNTTCAYTLTGLTNYTWHTVTLNAMLNSTPFLTDTVRVMPTDLLVYLPLVLKGQ